MPHLNDVSGVVVHGTVTKSNRDLQQKSVRKSWFFLDFTFFSEYNKGISKEKKL